VQSENSKLLYELGYPLSVTPESGENCGLSLCFGPLMAAIIAGHGSCYINKTFN
jgi:hypothetical protein